MIEILNHSQAIKNEADELLRKYKVVEIIEKFGQVKFTGSYALNLMYKKDIDISLINDNLSVQDFTRLGKELIDNLNSPSVYYRNTRITPVDKRPENSLYWGIRTSDWFIDLWAMSREVYKRAEKYIEEIKSKLTKKNRLIILQLKSEFLVNKTYGTNFGSRELYDAVLNHKVKSSKQFNLYLEKLSRFNEYR
jgi:hypothetical protein